MDRSLPKIPVELHSRILQYAIAAAQKDEPSLRRFRPATIMIPFFDPSLNPPPSEDTPAVQRILRSSDYFPFNAAYVCTMWRDILSSTPECWKRVIFDLARDPTPILDAFEWSKPIDVRALHVLVYNSSDPEHMNVALERKRVQAIAQALQGHIERCESITFDTLYSSSLPLPGMFFLQDARALTDLALTCRVDDMDANAIMNVAKIFRFQNFVMNRLVKISLTGFGFISLLTGLKDYGLPYTEHKLDIHVTKFAFPPKGPCSLASFVRCLARASYSCSHFFFHDLSLSPDYSPSDAEILERRPAFQCSFDFIQSSHDFLQQFFSLVDLEADNDLQFEDCLLPEQLPISESGHLDLKKFAEDTKGTVGFMRRAFLVWQGQAIAFDGCPAFNDDFLRWWGKEHDVEMGSNGALSSNGPPTDNDQTGYSHVAVHNPANFTSTRALPLSEVDYLYVHDCTNFSPSVLRESLIARWDIAEQRNIADGLPEVETHNDESDPGKRTKAINDLTVVGNVPALTEEDKEWFRQNEPRLKVSWTVGESEYDAFEVGCSTPRYFNPLKPWETDSD